MLLIIRCLERLFLARYPNLAEIVVDLISPALPLVNHGELLAEFLNLFLNAIFLARGSNSHKLVFIRLFSQTKREREGMVSLQAGTG